MKKLILILFALSAFLVGCDTPCIIPPEFLPQELVVADTLYELSQQNDINIPVDHTPQIYLGL